MRFLLALLFALATASCDSKKDETETATENLKALYDRLGTKEKAETARVKPRGRDREAPPAPLGGDGFDAVVPDGYRVPGAGELARRGATGTWLVRTAPVGGFTGNIGVLPNPSPEMDEHLRSLQTLGEEEAGARCRALVAGVGLGSERAAAVSAELVSTAGGRTCRGSFTRGDRADIVGEVTWMRAKGQPVMILGQFAKNDTTARQGYRTFVGAWRERPAGAAPTREPPEMAPPHRPAE